MSKKPSIRDLAQHAGVSITTVSLVLNGKNKKMRISKEVAKRILKIAEEINYRPNHFAQGLRTGKTKTIGLIVDDISNYFFGHMAKTVEEEADRLGYTVMFCSSENNAGKSRSLLNMLVDKQMDGYIIAPTKAMIPELEQMIEDNKPAVLIDRYYDGLNTSYVTIDNLTGSTHAVNHLVAKGNKRIALVTNKTDQLQMQLRIQGYEDAMRNQGLDIKKSLIKKIPFGISKSDVIQEITQFIQTQKRHFDAIFFTSNNLGVAGLEALRMLNLKVPEQFSVICFDDNDLFRLGSPGITVISQPINGIAKKSVELLVKQIESETLIQEHIVLNTELIERESVASKL